MQKDQVSLLGMIFLFYNGTVDGVQKLWREKQQQPPQPPGDCIPKNTQRKIMAVNLPSSTGELFEPWEFLPGQPHRAYTSGFTPTVTEVWKLVMTIIPRWTWTCIDCNRGVFESRNRNGNAESPWILFSFVCHGVFFFFKRILA